MMFKTILLLLSFRICICNVTQENFEDDTITTTVTTVFNSSEFVTEFDYNISALFNSTETSITKANETLTFINKQSVEHDENEVSCLCDLHINECDIGCCCDEDCTYEKKKIFERCDGITNTNVDRSFCQYLLVDYVNFTVHEWEIQNNDFLCVAKTNLPPSYTLQGEKPFRSYTETRLQVETGHFWRHEIAETLSEVNFSEPYVQGIPIKYVVNNSSLGIFKLCESFFMSGCNFQSDISYLHDFESQCVHVLNENINFLKADFYRTILFVAQPEKFNRVAVKNKLLTCPEPVCLKPNVKICTDVHFRNCKDVNETEITFRCHTEGKYVTCLNIVDSLKFIISHNGTEGMKNISLMIHLVNATYESILQYEINQELSVAYKWASMKTNYSGILSGNPGYLIGRPILMGNLVNGTILRDSDSYLDNFLILPQEDMGLCKIGKHSYQPIEFGYSTILLCRLKGSLSLQNNSKPADICKKVQVDIFRYWGIVDTNGYILNKTYGLFGNANSSILEDWRDVLFEKLPKEVLDNITGRFWNKNKTLSCHGLVFGLNIDIYHARVDVKKLVDQEKILGIANQFHLSSKENSTFDVINHKINYTFDLDTRVAFHDITSQKLSITVDPPSLNIKLPSDFFYPFVKMGNGGVVVIPHSIFVFFSCLHIIFLLS